jgi:dienelactone hydrolase
VDHHFGGREGGVVTDHPVLIPTSIGPIGGMISDPGGEPRAAVVLIAGVGGRRFGVNRLWTSLAWDLAERGLVVLRVDYPGGQGDSIMATKDGTLRPFREVVSWFEERTQGLGLLLIGACFGARLAVSVGALDERIQGVGFITPTFVQWKRRGENGEEESLASKVRRKTRKKLGRVAPLSLDPRLVEAVAHATRRMRVWAVVGEKDHRSRTDLSRLTAQLDREGQGALEIEEIPGLILHTQPTLDGQRTTRERVAAWAVRSLNQEVAVS